MMRYRRCYFCSLILLPSIATLLLPIVATVIYLSVACQFKCFSKRKKRKEQMSIKDFTFKAIRLPGVPPREGWAPVRLNKPFLEVDNSREWWKTYLLFITTSTCSLWMFVMSAWLWGLKDTNIRNKQMFSISFLCLCPPSLTLILNLNIYIYNIVKCHLA